MLTFNSFNPFIGPQNLKPKDTVVLELSTAFDMEESRVGKELIFNLSYIFSLTSPLKPKTLQ